MKRALLLPCVVAAATAWAPAQTAARPVPDEAIAAVLRALDAHFARGDAAGFLGMFEADHPGAHAMFGRQIDRLLAAGPRPDCRSTVTTPPRLVGDRTVVRVRHALSTAARAWHLDTMLALRAGADGAAVPTFAVEIPARQGCVRGDRFVCPPCNYEVGGVDGWLCVPQRPERAQALEAASFYRIGTDLACDVSVRIDAAAPTAAAVARDLGASLLRLDANAQLGPVEVWLPPAHAAAPPPDLAAARLDVALPRDYGGRGGIVRFHVVTFGGLQHVLLVRGAATTLAAHGRDLDALLASYRLLETDLDLAVAAAAPLHHHTGGRLRGGTYHNDRFDFELTGPDGWQPALRCGGAALRVVWTSPEGSRLWLTGYDVPQGLERWDEATAEAWLQQVLERADLVVLDGDGTDAPTWSERAECGGRVRTLRCEPRRAPSPGAPRQRTLHVSLHDELLLVADQQAVHAADAAGMAAAIATLRRR